MCTERRQRGLTLIELTIFIVIVSVGIAGLLSVLNVTARASADPVAPKQALAIAQALLEEITLMPYTYCDPDDPQAASASAAVIGPSGCAATIESPGPEGGEVRFSPSAPFDNVNDYDGYTLSGIRDIAGSPVAGLENFAVSVRVVAAALGSIPATDALRVSVSVSAGGMLLATLESYRARHAPNATP
jgi:MSHA pilin protein MshD